MLISFRPPQSGVGIPDGLLCGSVWVGLEGALLLTKGCKSFGLSVGLI